MSWTDQDIDHLFQGAKAPEPPPFEESFWTEMEGMLPPANDDIDLLFKGAVAPGPPPFKEAYWTEMEALLPPQKKRRVAALWWFSGGAAMLALALSAWYFAGGTNATANKPAVAAESAATEKEAVDAQTANVTGNTAESLENAAHEYPAVSSVPQNKGGKNAVPVDRAFQTLPVNYPIPNDRLSAANAAEDIRHGESLPDETPGTISTTAAVVNPLNPLPFDYELDEVGRRLPDEKQPHPSRFYVQVSAGIGQSAQRDVVGSSDFLHYYSVGGGLFTRVDNVVLTFGLSGRVDFADNIVRTVGTETPGNRIETRYNQLYSLETPASLGYTLGRNVIAATVTPGFQTGFSGQENEFQEETHIRSDRTSGNRVKNARTLTMEFGLSYWRTLQPDWQIGAAVNFDALRPFNNSLFAGEQRMAPLNGQLILRRTF